MDKAEYHLRLEELTKCVENRDYAGALTIVDSIEWRRVKSIRTLNMVADVYEANKRYRECKNILLLAYDRASIGKSILYRLVEICLKLGELEEAVDFYTEFAEVAPHDNSRFILKYKIYKARRSPVQDQIAILEEYKEREYTERWAYELAMLYSRAGNQQKCVETCDDLILWFSEGKYVRKAMELKQKYQPLSPIQQAAYQKELDREASARRPAPEKTEESAAVKAAEPPETAGSREILQRMDQAGAAITKDVSIPEEVPQKEDSADTASVTSREFMGKTADLREQLARSIHDVFSGIRKEAPQVEELEIPETEAAPDRMATANLPIHELEPELVEPSIKPVERPVQDVREVLAEEEQIEGQMSLKDFNLEALVQETADSLSEEIASDALVPAEASVQEKAEESLPEETEEKTEEPLPEEMEEKTEEPLPQETGEKTEEPLPEETEEKTEEPLPQETEEKTEEPLPQEQEKKAPEEAPRPRPLYNEELEIPDPEPTPEEKAQRTITLSTIGQNTIPISIDELLMEETPEERRIRILNDAKPVRMNDEQRKIFTYFARVPGMDQQILEAMNGVYEHAGEHTSKHGNIAIMGASGTGKTQLTRSLMVALCKDLQLDVAKTARITGEAMNDRDPAKIVSKMSGGFLVIDGASEMTAETVEQLNRAMEFRTDCMILIIEDEKANMRAMLKQYPDFAGKFDKVISIPVFTNDELVTFARTYATENGCKMDEMGVLALYTLIGNHQSEREPMTISQVKDMVDKAMAHARKTPKKRGRKKAGRGRQQEDFIILQEKDFEQ